MQGFLPAISVLSKQYLFQQRSCFIGKFLLGCSHVAWLCQWVFGPVLQLVFDPAWFVLGLIWLLRKGVHGSRISARGQLCCGVELLGLIPFPGGEFVSWADNAGGFRKGAQWAEGHLHSPFQLQTHWMHHLQQEGTMCGWDERWRCGGTLDTALVLARTCKEANIHLSPWGSGTGESWGKWSSLVGAASNRPYAQTGWEL